MEGLLVAGFAELLEFHLGFPFLAPNKDVILVLTGGAGKRSDDPFGHDYSTISLTTPAPTVWPPSRTANLRPCSIAIGVINVPTISTLSPGITISTPAGNSIDPVT